METKEQLLAKVSELQAIINKMDSDEPKKFLLDSINGSVQFWLEKSDYIGWYKDKKSIIFYDRKTKILYLNYYKIWSVFESKFGLNDKQIKELCGGIFTQHFNCDVVTTKANAEFTMF
jgi:hypothetical protein